MLKFPFELLEKRGINRYYTLNVNEIDYLAVETVLEMSKDARKVNSKLPKEFTQALKILPLTAPMLFLLLQFTRSPNLGEKEDTFGDLEPVYSPLQMPMVKTQADELFASVEKNFYFADSVENPTITSLIDNEGFELYCVEEHSKHLRSSWLVYTNERGLLRITEVITAGKEGFGNVISTNSYVLDRSILVKLFDKLKKNELN
jgi:hypothetical protein